MKKAFISFCSSLRKTRLVKNLVAVVAVGLGFLTAQKAMAIQSLEIVKKNPTTGNVEFAPETLASPIIDAIISTVKYGAVIVLVVLGVYLIFRFFKGSR